MGSDKVGNRTYFILCGLSFTQGYREYRTDVFVFFVIHWLVLPGRIDVL
jgi:hypothetical protein